MILLIFLIKPSPSIAFPWLQCCDKQQIDHKTMVSTMVHHLIQSGMRRATLLLTKRRVDALPISKSALRAASTFFGPGQPTVASSWVPQPQRRSHSSSSHNDGTPSPSPLPSVITELEGYPLNHPDCNVTSSIASRIHKKLHLQPQHPLQILHAKIQNYFLQRRRHEPFLMYDDISPIVSTRNNFDLLRIPPDHISRSKSDTYYLNPETVLRTHTSAHQVDLLSSGVNRFLVTGDVYRRDEIDQSHYPVFHQTEGVKVVTPMELEQQGIIETTTSVSSSVEEQTRAYIEADLKMELEGLASHLFGSDTEMRWVDAYFPFTTPSYELEIFFRDEWLEVLGCGVIHPEILRNAGRPRDHQGWAFGLGLERLAMVLFEIPDIRLFWTEDERFHQQFSNVGPSDDTMVRFQPYSKFPSCSKDISFWIDRPEEFHVNDLNELVREVAGDLVEEVTLVDTFSHPKTNRVSHCYRISYRSMDRSLTNEEIDRLQDIVRKQTEDQLGVKLR
jgi:phenylalanyl-tRNA synthetase alpha chain